MVRLLKQVSDAAGGNVPAAEPPGTLRRVQRSLTSRSGLKLKTRGRGHTQRAGNYSIDLPTRGDAVYYWRMRCHQLISVASMLALLAAGSATGAAARESSGTPSA